jgi:autotransporter passenger strand-loop-strand repeat protein
MSQISLSDPQSLFLDSATVPDFTGDPETINPLVVTKTLNNTLYQPVNFESGSAFGSPFTIGAAGAITVAGYNAITSFLTSAVTVINEGKVRADDVGTTHGNGIVLLTDGGVVTNGVTGTISGGYLGIYALDFATITNAGTDSGGGFGIFLRNGGDVSNSGLIDTPNATSHSALGYNQTAIDLHGPGTITNLRGGTVSGFIGAGIKLGVGDIINAGSIRGGVLGIYLGDGGLVNNSGVVTASYKYNNGVLLVAGGELINSGVIYAQGALGYGALFGGVAFINNSGTIRAGNEAVQAYASGQITNTKLITGGFAGIAFEANTLDTAATIINAGSITGGTDGVQIFASGNISNSAGGLIEGGTTAILFEAVTFAQTATVSNFGTIASGLGATGIAIDFGTAAAELIIGATGTFIGTVTAEAAAGNVLEFSGSRTGTLSGIGTEFEGFQTIKFATGATAAIEGDLAGLAAGEKITGFAASDKIILDGFLATSASYAPGKSITLDAGTATATLDITGKLTGDFLISHGAAATTLGAAPPTPSLSNGSIELVLNKGTQANAVVNASGVLEVYAGGRASAVAVNAGGLLEIFSGGTASGVNVSAGGTEELFGGGTTAINVIRGGGREIIESGANTSNTTLAGGTLEIAKGGTLSNGVHFNNSGGTLQLDGGAAIASGFSAGVIQNEFLVLEGKSKTALAGLGTTITGFQHIDFAAGAAWTIEGNITGLSNGETITGFATGDTLKLDGFGALSATYLAGDLDLFNGGSEETVTLGLAKQSLLIQDSGANSTIAGIAGTASLTLTANEFELVTSGAKAKNVLVRNGGAQFVASGGVASGSRLNGGHLTVSAAGTISGETIAGGLLDVASGAVLTGAIDFSGTGGQLVLASKALPTNTISGFTAGDAITLAGIAYVKGAKVAVKTAGVVTITDGGKSYKLNIADATVGEKDFAFGAGSVLTRGTTAAMAFLRPSPPPAAAAMPAAPPPAMPSSLSPTISHTAFGGVDDLLRKVADGGMQIGVTLSSPWVG